MSASVKAEGEAPAKPGAKQKSIVEIYTDWANHYLEKTRGRHKIRCLQTELNDGLLLAEVIEAVTHQKVPDITKKPKNRAAMVTNIQACLGFLLAKGVSVEEISPEEVHDGNLKAILGLFFQLSRFKQQQKQQTSTPASPAKLSSIPVPGSIHSPRKVQGTGLKRPGEGSQEKGGLKSPRAAENVRPPSGRVPVVPKQEDAGKQGVLQRMKMIPRPGLGKRTSSSSGFSSGRSTMSSESSVSLSSDTNFPSPSALRRIQETENVVKRNPDSCSPGSKLGIRAKLAGGRDKSSSPKRSPKLGRAGSELKDYGMIDSDGSGGPKHYPPHAYSRSNSGVNLKRTNISSSPHGPSRAASSTSVAATSSIPPPRSGIRPPCPPVRTTTSSLEKKANGIKKTKEPTSEAAENKRPDTVTEKPNGQDELPLEGKRTEGVSNGKEEGSGSEAPSSQRTCSLPRARRRGDSSPTSQPVAVVSPMPSIHRSKSSSDSRAEAEEDPMRGIAPMAPLGGLVRAPGPGPAGLEKTPSMQTVNPAALLAGPAGYSSDSEAFHGRPGCGYTSEGGADHGRPHLEDGYRSEGGSEVCGRRASQRMAYEQQRAAAEAEHRRFLERNGKVEEGRGGGRGYTELPSVLGRPTSYRVHGGRRNIQKTDSGIQTERSAQQQLSQQQEHWRAAMEHNKQVLTNQEHAMKEYLRRQQVEAEKHIRQYSPGPVRRAEPSASVPGTPQSLRKHSEKAEETARRLQEEHMRARLARGGSLERHSPQMSRKEWRGKPAGCETDSEYSTRSPGSPKPGVNSKSLPKRTSTSQLNYGLLMGQIQQKRAQRKNKSVDGSVSDSNYSSYSEIQGMRGSGGSAHQWLQPSSTYGGWASAQEDHMGSSESLNSISSSIKQARANSLANYPTGFPTPPARQEETEYYGIPFMLQRPSGLPSSQPTSPTHPPGHRHSAGQPSYSSLPAYSAGKTRQPKLFASDIAEDLNGSSASLISNGSSVYSSQEEKTAADIRKLQNELVEEHNKVLNLTTQLSTNAHVVSAFEQSLANMTARLHQITRTAEQKDSEVATLRQEIARLRQSGADAGLCKQPGRKESTVVSPHALLRQVSSSSVNSLSSAHSNSSLNSGDEGKAGKSMKKGWLRSSFSKVLGKGKQRHKSGSVSDCEPEEKETKVETEDESPVLDRSPSATSLDKESEKEESEPKVVVELKQQLIEKDTLLTETRLEALSSVHQLESLKETVNKMKTELVSLRQENEKLAVAATSKSIGSSDSSLNTSNETERESSEKRTSVAMSDSSIHSTAPSSLDMSATTDPSQMDSKTLAVMVVVEGGEEVRIGTVAASGALSWALLDSLVERLLTEYFMRLDPVSNLGLSVESLLEYRLGEVLRRPHQNPEPELLPYGYIIGEVRSLGLQLKGREQGEVDSLALATLVPRSIVQRYLGLLKEHRRLIISGPPGTGKSTLAAGLASLVTRSSPLTITLASTDKQAQVASILAEVHQVKPEVVVLDNLHLAVDLESLLGDLASTAATILATLTQAGGGTTDLQLRTSFRWVLLAHHVEPVRGFLGRSLKRRLLAVEVESRSYNSEAYEVAEWVARAALVINKFLEAHSSPDSLLPTSTWLSCPTDPSSARTWFLSLWNLTIAPHILDAVREGLQLYGRRASWEDPVAWVLETWPWAAAPRPEEVTRVRTEDVGYDLARPVSLGSRPVSASCQEGAGEARQEDPLFNMLMTLQEAANTQAADL